MPPTPALLSTPVSENPNPPADLGAASRAARQELQPLLQSSIDSATLDGRIYEVLQSKEPTQWDDSILKSYRDLMTSEGREPFSALDTYLRRKRASANYDDLPKRAVLFSGPENIAPALAEDQRTRWQESFRGSTDPEVDQMRMANRLQMESELGEPISPDLWDIYRNQYAAVNYGQTGPVDERTFYRLTGDHIRTRLKSKELGDRIATRMWDSSLRGTPLAESLAQAQEMAGDQWPQLEPLAREAYAGPLREFTDEQIATSSTLWQELAENAAGRSTTRREDDSLDPGGWTRLQDAYAYLGRAGTEEREKIYAIMAQRAGNEGMDVEGFLARTGAAASSGFDRLFDLWFNADLRKVLPHVDASIQAEADPARRAALIRMRDVAQGQIAMTGAAADHGIAAKRFINNQGRMAWDSLDDYLLMAVESGPTMAFAATGAPGLASLYLTYREENAEHLEVKYPTLSDGEINTLSALSGAAQTALDALDFSLLKARVPQTSRLLSQWGRAGKVIDFGADVARHMAVKAPLEFGQEVLQDLTPTFIQELASAIDSDIPGAEVMQAVRDEFANAGDLAGVSAVFSLIGGIGPALVNRADGARLQATLRDRTGLALAGVDATTAARISTLAADGQLREALGTYQDYLRTSVPETRRQFSAAAVQRLADYSTAGAPRISAAPDGSASVRWGDGTRENFTDRTAAENAIRSSSQDHATALGDYSRAVLSGQIGSWTGEQFTRLRQSLAKSGIALESGPTESRTLADWAGTSAPRLAQARERVRLQMRQAANDMNLEIPDAQLDLSQWFIRGSSQNSYADGLTTISIRLADAMDGRSASATPLTVLEEVSEGVSKHLRDTGRVPLAKQIAWLRDAEARTRTSLLQTHLTSLSQELQHQAVDEGFSRLAIGYATGRISESHLPGPLHSFLNAFRSLCYEVLRLGREITAWRKSGTMDPELEHWLSIATGFKEDPTAGQSRDAVTTGRVQLTPTFSISREEALAIRRKIEAQEPLTISTRGISATMTAKEAVEWAKAQGAEGKASHPQIGEIEIRPRGIKNAIGHLLNPRKAAALIAMKELLPQATLMHYRLREGRPASYRLAARVDIDSVPYIARIIVDTDSNGNRFYNHELSDVTELHAEKNPQALIPGADPMGQQIGVEELEDTGKLLRWIYSVKLEERASTADPDTTFSIVEEKRTQDAEIFLHSDGTATVTWRDGELHEETFTSHDAAEAAVEEHVADGQRLNSPKPYEGPGKEQSRFNNLIGLMRNTMSPFFKRFELDSAAGRASDSPLKWLGASSIAAIKDGLADFAGKALGSAEDKLNYFGGHLAGYLSALGMSQETLVNLIRDTETLSGRPLLPLDWENLPPGLQAEAVERAWANLFKRYASGELKAVPASLSGFLRAATDLAHFGIHEFSGEIEAKNTPERYRTPEERRQSLRDRSERSPKKRTDRIIEKIRKRILQDTADRLDVAAHARGEIPDLTSEEQMILHSKFEIVLVYSEDGRLLDALTEHKAAEAALPSKYQGEKVIYVHQHPKGGPPSPADLEAICLNANSVFRILAKQPGGGAIVYEMKANPEALYPKWRDVHSQDGKSWSQHAEEISREYQQLADKKGRTLDAYRESLESILEETSDLMMFRRREF